MVGKFRQAWELGRVYLLDEETGLPQFEATRNAEGEELRLCESTRGHDIPSFALSSLSGEEMTKARVWGRLQADNPRIQREYKVDLAAWRKDGGKGYEPRLELWTEDGLEEEWAHMTQLNALGGAARTEAWEEKFVRGGPEGESESESDAPQAGSAGQGDDNNEATENPVVADGTTDNTGAA